MSLSLTAQTHWQEDVGIVTETGYHNIAMSQEMYALGANALRLYDDTGKEIPHLLRLSQANESMQMEMYDVVSDTANDSVNTLVVHNLYGEASRFYLCMKSADVHLSVSMRGSYDREQWFAVKQRSKLKSEHHPVFGEVAAVDFPWGDYTYYEITVINNSGSPLNISGVGRVQRNIVDEQYVEIRPGGFVVKEDPENNTVISFPGMKYPYSVEKLMLRVTGKGHYSRRAQIIRDDIPLRSIRLTSLDEGAHTVSVTPFDKDTQIIIYNENNLPLTVEDVKLYGHNFYLCAYLEKGTAYHIETAAEKRRYDISDFAKEIPLSLPVVETKNLRQVEQVTTAPSVRFFERPAFLWSVIILTGIGLVLLCLRMLKELSKKG